MPVRNMLVALFSTLSSVGVVFAISVPAGAVSNTITPPFDLGSRWYICQGYNSTGSHTGSSALSLDITGGPSCDKSASGANVRSPVSGTIAWSVAGSGSICVNPTKGPSIMLTHIDSSLTPGTAVTAGQIVGTIAKPGDRQNNNVSHLHIQAWSSRNCVGTEAQVPFDLAHGARICGAQDMPAKDEITSRGTWANTSFVAQSCTFIEKKTTGSIYRFWSDQKQKHFYTVDYDEAQRVADTWPDVWSYEPDKTFNVVPVGATNTCTSGTVPVYRFWSDQKQGHFYTADPAEKDRVVATWPDIWTYERIAYCAALTPTTESPDPVYRFWSDQKQGHFYTADPAEKDRVVATWPDIWTYERIAYYVRKQ